MWEAAGVALAAFFVWSLGFNSGRKDRTRAIETAEDAGWDAAMRYCLALRTDDIKHHIDDRYEVERIIRETRTRQ